MVKELDRPCYDSITTAIEDHPSNYPLLNATHKKRFHRADIEDYIGNYETIGDLIRDKVITEKMAYDELSYDVEKAWCNGDVQRVIAEDRKADGIESGPNAFFSGFELFAKFSLSKDHKACKDIDKE